MTILKFPVSPYLKSPSEYYEFHRTDIKVTGKSMELVAQVTERLHKGNSTVYRANVTVPGEGTFDIVCKLVYGKRAINRLRDEANYYAHELKKLQGRYVPNFRGFYEGEGEDGPTACLVTDYCGKPLRTDFWAMKTDQK